VDFCLNVLPRNLTSIFFIMGLPWTIFLQICLPLVLVVGAGWGMDRKFRLQLETLVKLNLYLLVPAFIFVRLLDTPMGHREAGWIVATVFSVVLLCGLISIFVTRSLGMDERSSKAHRLSSMLGNNGNFGIPVVTLAFGEAAASVQVYALVTMNVCTFTLGVFLANGSTGTGWRGQKKALSATLRQPSLYAVAAALTCKFLHIPVPSVTWLWEPLSIIASGLVPFALLTLGVQLSQTRPAPLRAPLISALAIRLAIAPLLAWALSRLLPLSDVATSVLILTSGAPVAVNIALLAHEFGGNREFATTSVFYSTLLSLITVTITLSLLKS